MKDKLKVTSEDKKRLPVFCNYIYYNKMVARNVEGQLFAYSEKQECIYGRENALRPISKILELDNSI